MRAPLVLALLVVLAPLVAAQHEDMAGGAGMAMVLHDGPDSGRAVAGGLTHLGFALLDAKGVPVVHQNAEIEVTLDNVTVFHTPDTHEYDGLFSLDMVFPHPGHYVVMAMSGKMRMGIFEGDVVPAANATVAKAAVKVEDVMPQGNAARVTVDVQAPNGTTIPHTDAILEWRAAGSLALVSRLHAHIHEKPIVVTQGFDAPGDYVLTVTAYKAFATGRSTDVEAVVGGATFSAGALALPAAPDAAAFPPEPMSPAGASAQQGGLTLHAMYDPQNQVAAGFPLRLSGLVEGKDLMPLPHVDFAFHLDGPRGRVFESASLHEYDGHFEYLYVPQVPGAYDGALAANDGDAKLTVPFHAQVVPPVAPLGLTGGPGASAAQGIVSVKGLEKITAGEPVNLTFDVSNPTGAIQHSEVDVTISQKGKPALYNFKMHTHESGTTTATVVFPAEGDWVVTVDPTPTDTGPVVFQGPDGPGMPIAFHAKVAPGTPILPATGSPIDVEKRAPGAPLALLVLSVAALALLEARRRA